MGKKKPAPKPVKVEFLRGYSGPEGIYTKGDTDVFIQETAQELIDNDIAKVYVPPPLTPAQLKELEDQKKED